MPVPLVALLACSPFPEGDAYLSVQVTHTNVEVNEVVESTEESCFAGAVGENLTTDDTYTTIAKCLPELPLIINGGTNLNYSIPKNTTIYLDGTALIPPSDENIQIICEEGNVVITEVDSDAEEIICEENTTQADGPFSGTCEVDNPLTATSDCGGVSVGDTLELTINYNIASGDEFK